MDQATTSRGPAPDRAAPHHHWDRPDPVGDILATAWSSAAAEPREIRVRPEVYHCILAELDPAERALVEERGVLGSPIGDPARGRRRAARVPRVRDRARPAARGRGLTNGRIRRSGAPGRWSAPCRRERSACGRARAGCRPRSSPNGVCPVPMSTGTRESVRSAISPARRNWCTVRPPSTYTRRYPAAVSAATASSKVRCTVMRGSAPASSVVLSTCTGLPWYGHSSNGAMTS